MSEPAQPHPNDEIRDTIGAPTILEMAREKQRRADGTRSEAAANADEGGEESGQQWQVRRMNPGSVNESDGGKKKERLVVQKDGMTDQGEEGAEHSRDAASFLGKKLFGERFSSRVDDEGRQQEGGSDGEDGDAADKGKKAKQNKAGKTGKEAEGEDGTDDSGTRGPRVTKTAKPQTALTREDIASVVKATLEGTRQPASSESREGSHVPDAAQELYRSMSSKDKANFQIINKMAEMNDQYKELPQQYIEFQQAKKEYAKEWGNEHPGEKLDWNDEEHQQWVGENQPQFDEEDFVDARIEIRADAVAAKRLEKFEEKLTDTERRASEGTIKQRAAEQAKVEVGSFVEEFLPESDWDLSTDEGKQAAIEENPVIGEISARWADTIEKATEKIVRLYEGRGLWEADMNDPIDRYLANLAMNWENQLSQSDVSSTKNSQGQMFATRDEYRKMSAEDRKNHWIIGKEELLWILPKDIKARAEKERDEELDRLEKLAKAKGWEFDRETFVSPKKKAKSAAQKTPSRNDQGQFTSGDERPPSSNSGSKVNTDARRPRQENKTFSELLVKQLFGR